MSSATTGASPNDDIITAAEADHLSRAYLAHHSHELDATHLAVLGWHTAPIGTAPAGFLSQQLRLTIRCTLKPANNPDSEQTSILHLPFFLKTTATATAAQLAYCTDFAVFRKEIRLYAQLLPAIAAAGGSAIAPHCFYTRPAESAPQLLVFEDLAAAGYANCSAEPADGLLDRGHLLLCVEALAALHANAWVLEKTRATGPLSAAFGGHLLDENAYPVGADAPPARRQWVAASTAALCALVEQMPGIGGRGWEPRLTAAVARIFDFAQPSRRFRNCFAHGDLWRNNVMFKYAELTASHRSKAEAGGDHSGGEATEATTSVVLPVDVRFVDFQLARYAPPALDLMTICTMCTSAEFRRSSGGGGHLQAILDAYYAHLAAVLERHGLSARVELPRAEFEASCKWYRLAGLIESCLFSHMTLLPRADAERVVGAGFGEFMGAEARVQTCVRAWQTDTVYRERMGDMLGALVEFIGRDQAEEKSDGVK